MHEHSPDDVPAAEPDVSALQESEARFRSMIEHASEAMFCYEYRPPIPTGSPIEEQIRLMYDAVLVECNAVAARTYGAERPAQVIGRRLTELFRAQPGELDDFFRSFIDNGYRLTEADTAETLPDGTVRHFRNSGQGIIEGGRLRRVWGTYRDVTEFKWSEERLRFRSEFEELIAEISTRFISLPPRAIEREIESAVERIGRFCDVDYTIVYAFSPDKKLANRVAQWEREPDPEWDELTRVISLEPYAWAASHLLQGKPLIVRSEADIPESEGLLRELRRARRLESSADMPMKIVEDVVGFVGFGTMGRARAWTEEEITLLSMVTPIIANALSRKRSDEDLRRALDEVASLKKQLEAENVYLREEIDRSHGFEGIAGKSPALLNVLHQVEQVAPTDSNVLVLGETGTGKELIARSVHGHSTRAGRPLVKVDCAGLPATLIESELFGHERGAFTGAFSTKIGRFELADGGTVFLDEIGNLPLEIQAKLLRVLQDGQFERVGSSESRNVDVRVIAATNRDLERAVQAEEFRADLYYRLGVFPIEVPPLRERKEDIPHLTWHFVREFQDRIGRNIERVPTDVMQVLQAYDWPGNVRELRNVVERAVIVSSGPALEIKWKLAPEGEQAPATDSLLLDDVQRSHILRVLKECDWKLKGPGNAAERLGLNPSTLRSRMKKLGISRTPAG